MVICAGSGGVGKTTTAAAVALGLAERGLKVAVVTIDPARRLANALGLDELDNEPRRVDARRRGRAVGDDARRQAHVRRADRAPRAGRAHARRGARQPDLPAALERGRRLAGVHGDRQALRARPATASYDVLVLDTPPSRNALDFLDAPGPADALLPGPRDPHLPAPRRALGRILGRGTGRRVRRPAARHGRRPAARPVGRSSARWAG